MNTAKRILALLLLAGMVTSNADAATLSLSPGAVSVTPGSLFSVDLVISGLGNNVAPSLGVFDIDIGFDPAELGFVGISLGSGLGDIGLGEAIDVSLGEYTVGQFNIAEVSFLLPALLDLAQPDTFTLATISFMADGLSGGESTPVNIAAIFSLGDSLGDPLTVDGLNDTVITAIVPIPATLWLFAGALAVLVTNRSR